MKKNLLFITLILITAASCVKDRNPPAAGTGGGTQNLPSGDTLMYYWNFNNQDSSARTADYSVPGLTGMYNYSASYIDFTGGSNLNLINGTDSGQCLRVRNPSQDLIFSMPTTGYDSVVLTYAEEASSTTSGSTINTITYTTDGVNYISTALTNNGGSNQASIGIVFGLYTFNFSSDPNVNNNPKFAVKITFSNNNTGTSGNDRFDNISLSGVRQ